MSAHSRGPFGVSESIGLSSPDPNEPDGLTPLDTLKALVGAASLAGYGVRLEPKEVVIVCKKVRIDAQAGNITQVFIEEKALEQVFEIHFQQTAGSRPVVDIKLLP